LKFTLNEDFPRLFFTRKKLSDKAVYFGPYPQIFYIKKFVNWVAKLFKIRPCNLDFSQSKLPDIKKVKSCLYFHTNICSAPCMGLILSKDYKDNIKDVRYFLDGKFKKLSKTWKKQMISMSKSLHYEEAALIRDRLYALERMSERVIINEINQEDIQVSLSRAASLNELKKVLHLSKIPSIIEGFDNSNIQGSNAVSSMVRFLNGVADKNSYRRFKIKTVVGANDFESMYEVVFRRYSSLIRNNSQMPDLILIDGGKGQLAAALKALEKLELKIPLISLAKKNEEIFRVNKDLPLVLPKNSQSLRLLQSIRDEAHRFAINYHRYLRKKSSGF
jgi:excinuclease ABC subunit C